MWAILYLAIMIQCRFVVYTYTPILPKLTLVKVQLQAAMVIERRWIDYLSLKEPLSTLVPRSTNQNA